MADTEKHTPVETELMKASNGLCKYLKANKNIILWGMTQRQTDGLLDALNSLDAAISAKEGA